jgi:hypothetical protein
MGQATVHNTVLALTTATETSKTHTSSRSPATG